MGHLNATTAPVMGAGRPHLATAPALITYAYSSLKRPTQPPNNAMVARHVLSSARPRVHCHLLRSPGARSRSSAPCPPFEKQNPLHSRPMLHRCSTQFSTFAGKTVRARQRQERARRRQDHDGTARGTTNVLRMLKGQRPFEVLL